MTSTRKKHRSMGIAVRIGLFSWMVALVTLLIFVFLTIPEQKKTFLASLESKANGLAVSLHDEAAGAAVNEDYASVVSAAQTLLSGDPDLDFLIVMKNDGFSLVVEQRGWRVEPNADTYWYDRERTATGGITTVPVFNSRVYHYAQPFDYSGIQWGWIHVGLSLKGYDQSVSRLYRNTVLLALVCIAFSLMGSVMYARQMVRPILRLRHIVHQIAGGELSVRADTNRHDELGSLAESVNSMTEALLRKDRILESVRFAAQKFLRTAQWEAAIDDVLNRIGQAANASRAYVWKNHMDDTGRLCTSQLVEWVDSDIPAQISNPDLQNLSYDIPGLDRWADQLGNNKIISGLVAEMSNAEREILEPQDIRALIVIPVFVGDTWWGFLGFDDCRQDRIWTDAEEDSLRAAADMLGATIARQQVQEALLEAKATLELRVAERTRELQDQVAAKEKALADLAEAQSSLVEMSRAAGMAEVATGVLHNVGNVLNSVNVSSAMLMDQLRHSRMGNVSKVAEMMAAPEKGLAHFLTEDPKGRQIPVYLTSLADALEKEHQVMFKEARSLSDRVEHIKEIVAMQQSYGRVSGVNESIAPDKLMEDAIKLNASSLARHEIVVRRQYRPLPPIGMDKHKALQILVNLINNAKQACTDDGDSEKIVTVRIDSTSPDAVIFQVMDNGMGIAPENMTRIFQHGFTTRRSGHGFGLHSGALAAREMGGSLSVHSDGPGKGATFTLRLPRQTGDAS